MKKILVVSVYTLLIVSCKPYIDIKGNKVDVDTFLLEYYDLYNKLTYRTPIGVIIHRNSYNMQHYEVKIPKKLIKWRVSNGVFYLDYGSNQIIIIDAGYSEPERKQQKWLLSNISVSEIGRYMHSYDKNFDEDNIISKKKRTTKLYSDGKTKIILYNINSNNFNNYLDLLNSFKYLN